ncbi:hypothetical protein [Brasilonema sp. UFV-L1]
MADEQCSKNNQQKIGDACGRLRQRTHQQLSDRRFIKTGKICQPHY